MFFKEIIAIKYNSFIFRQGLKFGFFTPLKRLTTIVLLTLFIQSPTHAQITTVESEHASNFDSSIANVTFIINSYKGFAFWDNQADYAKAVAEALDLNLTLVYIPEQYSDRFGVVRFFSDYLYNLSEKPDLIISALWLGAESRLLDILAAENIPLISINTALTEYDFSFLGKPREKYPLWLAHIATDDQQAGYELAEYIVNKTAQKKSCTQTCEINLFAFAGTAYTSASVYRERGLEQSLQQHANVSLFNVVNANWDRELTRSMMKTVLRRHDDIDAYWVLGDIMAMGVLDGLKEHGVKQMPIIGSIDWTPDVITQIEQGNVTLSLGGHFMEAGWALTMYSDYLRVGDFVEQFGTVFPSTLAKLDSDNVKLIGGFLRNPQWNKQVIKSNTRYVNSSLQAYMMEPEKLIRQHIKQNQLTEKELLENVP